MAASPDSDHELELQLLVCKGYKEIIHVMPCIQLSKMASSSLDLNLATTDINHCKGYVIILDPMSGNLSILLQQCSLNQCVACVIVNSEDSLDVTGFVNFDTFTFPVFFLKRENGMQLLKLAAKSKISIKTESVLSKFQKLHALLPVLKGQTKQCPEFMLKYYKDNWVAGVDIDHARDILKTTWQFLAKSGDEESTLFEMDPINDHIIFSEILEKSFPMMFPVYIFYVSTIMSKPDVYTYSGRKECIGAIVDELCTCLKELRIENIIQYVHQFRSDDKGRWKALANSFLHIVDQWIEMHNHNLPQNIFELAIPLIVIAQMILKECGAAKGDFQKLWHTHLLKYSDQISFRQQGSKNSSCHLYSFKEGMNTLSRLQVPQEFYFTPRHFKELFIRSGKVIPFLEASNMIICLPENLKHEWQTNFMLDFVMPLREIYDCALADHKYSSLESFCSQGDWISLLTEGVSFISRVNKFMKNNECKESFIDKSFHWMLMFAKCVDFASVKSSRNLLVLDYIMNEEMVVAKHVDFIKEKLCQQLKQSLEHFSPNQFLLIENYTKEKGISDNTIFRDYLRASKLSLHVNEGDMIYSKSGYHQVLKRYITRESKLGILDLLEPVYNYYSHNNRKADFFLDLIKLDTSESDLLKLPAKVDKNIREFLLKRMDPLVSKAILDRATIFMEAMGNSENFMQLVVCQVVLEGLQKLDIKIESVDNFMNILELAYIHFNDSALLPPVFKSARLKFTCGIVGTLASKMNLKTKCWVTDNPGITRMLEIMQPLHAVKDTIPESCIEARTCLQLYHDVKQSIITLNSQLERNSIPFDQLEYYRRGNCLQELRRIVDIVGIEEKVTEKINSIFEKFNGVRIDVTKILLPSFIAKDRLYYGSLLQVLETYGIVLPEDINTDLMNTIDPQEVKMIVALFKTGNIEIHRQQQLSFNGSRSLMETVVLLAQLKVFLGPLVNLLPEICFFQHFKSQFFINSTKHCLTEPLVTTSILSEFSQAINLSAACQRALSIVCRTAEGDATLKELEFEACDSTGKEIAIFEMFATQRHTNRVCYGYGGFKALLSLKNIYEGMGFLQEIFDRFELVLCIRDIKFEKLLDFSGRLRVCRNVPLKTAYCMKEDFHRGLPNCEGDFEVYFDLFKELRNSSMYVQFLRNKGFIGEAGKRKFSQERNLITQEIQQTLDQRILDDLWDAYSVLSIFLDTKITYSALKNRLEKLNNIEKCLLRIKALHQHSIKALDRIFALKESETKESTMLRLRKLIAFGTAVYDTSDRNSPITLSIVIKENSEFLELHTEELDLKRFSEIATAAELVMISLNEKELQDICDVYLFLQIYECCLEIIDLLEKLKNAGHFKYQKIREFRLSLAREKLQWKIEFDKLKTDLTTWEHETPLLREKYQTLSFFSNWKIFQMHKVVTERPLNVRKLEDIITTSLMCVDNKTTNFPPDILKIADNLGSIPGVDLNEPFSVVGELTRNVYESYASSRFKKNRSVSQIRMDSNNVTLHLLTDSTNFDIYSTALHLLKKHDPIAGFQIFTCTTVTTQEAITLFFERVKYLHQYRFIVIDVNVMSLRLQEVVMKECTKLLKQSENRNFVRHDIIFIESGPSVIRTMPWCFQDHITLEHFDSYSKARFRNEKISCKLIYGEPGNGKSHFIQSRINSLGCLNTTIPVNESFSVQKCIQKLTDIASRSRSFAIHVNFTIPYLKSYAITAEENKKFQMTCKVVNSFFFNLLICGYVEDFQLGESFSREQTDRMYLFVEVPVLSHNVDNKDCIKEFYRHFPVFYFLYHQKIMVNAEKFDVTMDDTLLVCKYFEADENGQLDKLYKETKKAKKGGDDGIRIASSVNFTPEKAISLLNRVFFEQHIDDIKIYQKMFVRYMHRRCSFMENSIQMRFFEGNVLVSENGQIVKKDVRTLRSSLLQLMKIEAAEMCAPTKPGDGYEPPSMQLIYNEGSFSMITNGVSTSINADRMEIATNHGFQIPGVEELKDQTNLENYLCMALKIKRGPDGEVPVLKDRGYVLTKDYLLKMIAVHERQQCGMPVIISGETGVGKTFLLETLNDIYNYTQQQKLNDWRLKLQNFMSSFPTIKYNNEEVFQNTIKTLLENDRTRYLSRVYSWFRKMEASAQNIVEVFSLIKFLPDVQRKIPPSYKEQSCMELLLKFLFGKKRKLFRVFRVHTGLTPSNIRNFIQPIIDEVCEILETNSNGPSVTVFFDEVNTSSCIGFLKELIVDHSLDGKPLPSNIFIVAACNPHRANSISTIIKPTGGSGNEKWFRGNYLVRQLHPSFHQIMWDFGYLKKSEEDEYIIAKLEKIEQNLKKREYEILKQNISYSQELIRQFTRECLIDTGCEEDEAKISSKSAVSQRDIQRVLKLYQWLKNSYKVLKKYGYLEDENEAHHNWHISTRALYVSLALVYYFRLNAKYREQYADFFDKQKLLVTVVTSSGAESNCISFTKALSEELEWLMQNIELPPGVADTKALRENLFAIITCCMTKIPLIIIGPPGCSKTLSFKIAMANLLGEVSPKSVFRSEVMKGLEPHIYQCSQFSLSEDIDALFEKAILRQNQINMSGQNATVVVFMDEAGLPDEKKQVLKVLHYHLDTPKVPFVALTNTALDAAKSNRAVCLFQINNSQDDLRQLSSVMLGFQPGDNISSAISSQINSLIEVYLDKMKHHEFNSIFGLRDIMHFFSYIRRRIGDNRSSVPAELIVDSLQRNFSGARNFYDMAGDFLNKCGLNISQIPFKRISALLAFKSSLADKPKDLTYENEVRYKLLVCRSEDEMLVQLLFKFGILQRQETKMYCLNKLQGDKLHKATVVAKIKNSIVNGHTITLAQCDEIFESFYDLFNQRFTYIDDQMKNTRNYYARIASGAKSTNCLVHPSFQCIVLVKQSEVQDIPAPFMNRFEKYPLQYESFINHMYKENKLMLVLLRDASEILEPFLKEIPLPGLYGFQDETLLSLVLAHVKMKTKDSEHVVDCITVSPGGVCILSALKSYCKQSEDENLSEIFEDFTHVLSIMENKLNLTLELVARLEVIFHDEIETKTVDDEDLLNCVHMITQFLCVRMMKELLQFMPPEVFLAVKEKLPKYYISSYLNHQFHFNLQELIKDKIEKSYRETPTPINKTLCYSRTTSSLFENLPHEFFLFDSMNKDEWKQLKIVFPDLCDYDINSLCVFQIFHNTTGISISRSIRKFLSVDNYYVMIFLVNMEYISKDTVNYLRFAIEEAEFNSDNRKQFILLLHFPAENFFLHCYPSFCQDNCDFYYLDSVAPTTEDNVIDLKKCFLYAFQDDSIRGTRKFMEEVVDSLLTQKLAVFCVAQIRSILPQYVHQSLVVSLLSTTEPNSIGQTLKLKFVQQWTPHRMMQALQQAANSALSLDYTLNMSDAMSTIIKSNFYDFVHYVLALLGRNDALPILFRNDTPIEILDLIRLQIANIDLPSSSTLMKLQTLRIASTSKTLVYFPSFDDVYNTVENVITQTVATYELNIEKCAKELNLTMERNALLSVTIQKMGENEELWLAYMLQFLNQFYSVTRNSNIFTYFSTLSQSHEDISNRIVWLHCSFDLIPQNIISFLGLADATSVDSNDKIDEESLKLLSHPEKCAKAVILRFHESLKSLSKRTSEDFTAKIKRLLVQYHEMFLSSPSKELIHMNLAPDIEAIRDGIAIFFTMIKTNIPTSLALDVLKHFTEDSFSFSEVLDFRTEYLLKIPVGRILDAPFPIVFKEEHATEYSMRYLMTAILEILITNSSKHQKEFLIDWCFREIFIHQEIQDIPMKRCYDSESISCMCFIDTIFVMIVKCDEPYFNSKLEQLCLKLNKSIKSYVLYFLRGIVANSGDQEKLEPLMTLLYLKELKTRSRDRVFEANLVNEYQKYDQVEHHVLTIVKKEAAVFLMIQETARNIVEHSNTLIHEVDTILSKHNYGILLTYCIFKRCKSFEQLRKFLLQEHELCKNFSCLQDIRRTYAKEKITTFPIQDCTCDLLQTFKQENKNVADNSIKIYDRVFSSVREMVNSSKKEIPQNLLDLMPDCCVISSHNKTNSTKCMFKISLFLSVYSFRKKIQVPEFKELMNLKANIYLESVFTDTLCAFISEGRNGLEQPEGLDGPLPVSFSKKHDMWDCVARLIATVLGASERFCNLTMHLLSPTSLDGSFIPGSTTQGKVGLNKREYQEAMGFTESGLCKSYDSFAYIVRGKASLPCMYFIQWANYACLYVHLLGMNSSKRMSPFKGELFTDPASGLSICLMSMEKLWDLFLQNLSITAEQRAILIKICIGKLLELLTNNKLEPFPAVVPSTQVELDLYEKFYNDEIFYPSWQRMIEETTKYNERLIPGSIDYKIMKIHENYPLLPDEHSFFIFLMTSTSFSDDYVYYYPLYQFLLERPKLYSAIAILPDLVNFYQWIHQQFPLCFTNEESKLITIGKLLSSEKYSHVGYTSEKAKIRKVQYSKICESTQLIQTTYKVCFDISALKDDIPLCDVVCTRQVAGLIKKWIDALVNINNSFLIRVSKTKFSITNNHIKKAHKTKCNASSLDAKNMFAVPVFKFDDVSDILPLLENSCCLSSVCCSETLKTMDENNDESLLMGSVLQVYHLNRLQEDVAASMISKLKMINKVQSMSFSFVNIDESVSNIFVESAAVGLEYLEENVPTPFKVEPDKNYLENALKYCHSLSYFSLLEITIGLRIAAEYLIQVYKEFAQSRDVLKNLELEHFLKEYVVHEEDAQLTKVFSQALGIDVTRLNQFQIVFICEMKMGSIMEALKTFVSWLQSGLYDFSSFSVVLKEELSEDHVKLLHKLKNEAISKGEEHEFLEAIILVSHSLSISEKKLRMINETSAQCEKSLEDIVNIKEIATGKYVGSFPNVPIGQYVRYRLALRMLHRDVLKTIQERALGRDLAWNVCINRQLLLDHLKIKVPQTEDLFTADSGIDLCDMTSEQIAEFIRTSGFDEKCALAALENDVDGNSMAVVKEKQLQKLLEMNSVSFLSFKVRIARRYGKLEVSQLARDYPPQKMVAICSKHDCFKSAIEFIDKYRIDGEMMLKADTNVFKQMCGDDNATIAENIIKSTLT